jgi:signal peptidase II
MKRIVALGGAALLVIIDQLIKHWGLDVLRERISIEIIPGLFNLTYVENRGAAFGVFQGQTLMLSIVTATILLAIAAAVALDKIQPDFLLWSISLGLAGGAGNLVDRVSRGFVVDYLDFSSLFGFPVFNFADCLVVTATALVLLYFLLLEPKAKAGEPE